MLMTEEALAEDPSVQRRKLGIELRRSREAASLNQREAADKLEWSLSKLTRIEDGKHRVSVSDLKSMIEAYKITDQRRVAALTVAARGSRGQAWWSDYRDVVSPNYARYLGHEGMARSFQIFHPFLVPGLLQTVQYATELLKALPRQDVARRLVDLRMERKERLFAQPGLSFTFIIGEEALYRWIGGPKVMRHQLEHLDVMSTRENVKIRIVPFRAGTYPGLLGSFIMLRLLDNDEMVIFQESPNGDQLVRDDPENPSEYIKYFETALEISLGEKPSQAVLLERIDRLRHAEQSAAGDGGSGLTAPLAVETPNKRSVGLADLSM
jgi:transcriptional regulator with XRE-family HTH domain